MAQSSVWKGYDRASIASLPRTIWLGSGEVGTGKTRFGLQMPAPILVQSLDKGMEGVVDQILAEQPDKEIYVREYDWNPQADNFSQEVAIELRDKILADFEHGKKHARSILWDKETDIRAVFQYAEFGGPTNAGNIKDYDRLNQRYFNLINGAKNVPGLNFGLIQSMKDEWQSTDSGKVDQNTGKRKKEMSKTGRRIRAGFDRLDELVMTELHFVRENGEFSIMVGKCRQNSSLMDQTIPACTYAELGAMLVSGTEEGDWQ